MLLKTTKKRGDWMEVRNLGCNNKSDSQDKDCGAAKNIVEKAEEVSEEKLEALEETEDVDCECVNHIVIKPNINMTFDIESLLTGQAVVETDNKASDEVVVCDCVNRIVIKPKVKIDCNLSGLSTTFAS